MPLIIATIDILKDAGLIGKNVKVDSNTIALEVANDPSASSVMSQLEPATYQELPVTQPELMINDAAVQRESNNTITSEPPITPTTPITTMENNNKPGLLSWVQANPLPSLAIAGAVGLILYKSLVVFILSLALTGAPPM